MKLIISHSSMQPIYEQVAEQIKALILSGELLEETGYGNGVWQPLMELSPNPGSMSNTTYCFLATGVEKIAEPCLDPTEDLSVYLMTREQVKELVDRNGIFQSLMVAPLLKYFYEYD